MEGIAEQILDAAVEVVFASPQFILRRGVTVESWQYSIDGGLTFHNGHDTAEAAFVAMAAAVRAPVAGESVS